MPLSSEEWRGSWRIRLWVCLPRKRGKEMDWWVKLAIMTLKLPEFSQPSAFTLFPTLCEGLHTDVLIPFL